MKNCCKEKLLVCILDIFHFYQYFVLLKLFVEEIDKLCVFPSATTRTQSCDEYTKSVYKCEMSSKLLFHVHINDSILGEKSPSCFWFIRSRYNVAFYIRKSYLWFIDVYDGDTEAYVSYELGYRSQTLRFLL